MSKNLEIGHTKVATAPMLKRVNSKDINILGYPVTGHRPAGNPVAIPTVKMYIFKLR